MYSYIVHPILSGPAISRINESVLEELVVADTVPLSKSAFLSRPPAELAGLARIEQVLNVDPTAPATFDGHPARTYRVTATSAADPLDGGIQGALPAGQYTVTTFQYSPTRWYALLARPGTAFTKLTRSFKPLR